MRGYYTDTLNLINTINKKSEGIPLEKSILQFKSDFALIANKIRAMTIYRNRIRLTAAEYETEMKDKYKKEEIKKPLFVVYYLDLLRKLKDSSTAMHQIMSICVVVPLIDKEITLLEEKDGE